jgi:predicted DNA-binding ribbon-helix-helix protein
VGGKYMKLESIVNKCLIQHEGGEKFFDALDEMMRNDTLLITMLIGKVLENPKFDYIIVSGNFGKLFKEHCYQHMPKIFSEKVIVVPGGLRNGTKVTPFWNDISVENKEFLFLDDSYYLGRTRNVIKKEILEHGGELISTYVFYDGSKIKEDDVYSFYRYFDHHPEELKNPSFEEQNN